MLPFAWRLNTACAMPVIAYGYASPVSSVNAMKAMIAVRRSLIVFCSIVFFFLA